jgi:hypothetical protein
LKKALLLLAQKRLQLRLHVEKAAEGNHEDNPNDGTKVPRY